IAWAAATALRPGYVLDGELAAWRQGHFAFEQLLRSRAARERNHIPVSYAAFDVRGHSRTRRRPRTPAAPAVGTAAPGPRRDRAAAPEGSRCGSAVRSCRFHGRAVLRRSTVASRRRSEPFRRAGGQDGDALVQV